MKQSTKKLRWWYDVTLRPGPKASAIPLLIQVYAYNYDGAVEQAKRRAIKYLPAFRNASDWHLVRCLVAQDQNL